MPEYRVFLQERDGRLRRGACFVAADDAAAIATASAEPRLQSAELWQGGRCVKTFAPSDPGPAAGPGRPGSWRTPQ